MFGIGVRNRVLPKLYSILVVFKNQKARSTLARQHKTPNLSQKQQLFYSVSESNVLYFRSRKVNTFLSPGIPTCTRIFTHNCSTGYRQTVGCLRGVVSIREHLQQNTYQRSSQICSTVLTRPLNILQDAKGSLLVDIFRCCTVSRNNSHCI